MPKSIKQRRGEIINTLRGKDLISPAELEEALADAGIESPAGVIGYVDKLETLGYLVRVSGGWELSEESKETGVITIKVIPKQNLGEVARGLGTVLPQFGKITTMEVEV